MIRKPAVAGRFYPSSKVHLEKEVKEYLNTGLKKRNNAIGIISPHAGYVYSGHVAGAVMSSVTVPEYVIVISPNHTGMGAHAALMDSGAWETPLGNVSVDLELSKKLLKNCPELISDMVAHLEEHSLEVQLPFLQVSQPNLKIVPITVSHLRYETCELIGHAIAKTINDSGKKVLIVASSDMTHYEPATQAKRKDMVAIEQVIKLDARNLLETCARERITMCGVIPSTIMLIAAKDLGARHGELIKYATSGDVTGDQDSVVGYAGMVVY